MNAALTQRECGIVWLICAGMNCRAIGQFFGVPRHIVRHHLSDIHRKTHTRTTAQLAYWWVKSDKIRSIQKEI